MNLYDIASISFPHALILLIFLHFWADFSSQNDFVAKFKSPFIDGKYNQLFI